MPNTIAPSMSHHKRHLHRVPVPLSWEHISDVLSDAVQRVEAFKPSMLLAVSSGGARTGGSVPALMLKACLQHDGFDDVPVLSMNLTSSDVTGVASWTPEQLNGAHVLLVEKADDSRRTLSTAVAQMERIFAAAAAAAAGDPNWQAPQLGVFVLQNKLRAKDASLPAALLESNYFAAEEVEDATYQYPWDREDNYMTAWRGACATPAAAAATTTTTTSSSASMVSDACLDFGEEDDEGESAAVVPHNAVAAAAPDSEGRDHSFTADGPSWIESLGPAFIAAWRDACAGYDAEQCAAAAQRSTVPSATTTCGAVSRQVPVPRSSWRRQIGHDFVAAWRGASGAQLSSSPLSSSPPHVWRRVDSQDALAAMSCSPERPLVPVRVGGDFMAAWRDACAGFDAEEQRKNQSLTSDNRSGQAVARPAATWRQQLGEAHIAAWRGACSGDVAPLPMPSSAEQHDDQQAVPAGCSSSSADRAISADVADRAGAAYASSWRAACACFDANQQAHAEERDPTVAATSGLAPPGPGVLSWEQQLGDDYFVAWQGACHAKAPIRPAHQLVGQVTPVTAAKQEYEEAKAQDGVAHAAARFADSWRGACAGFDADQQVADAAAEGAAAGVPPSWRQQVGDDYRAAWRGACGATNLASRQAHQRALKEVQAALPPAAATASGEIATGLDAERVGAGFKDTWREACAGFDAEQQDAAKAGGQDTPATPPSWRQQLGDDYAVAWQSACGAETVARAPPPPRSDKAAAQAKATSPSFDEETGRKLFAERIGVGFKDTWREACGALDGEQAAAAKDVLQAPSATPP